MTMALPPFAHSLILSALLVGYLLLALFISYIAFKWLFDWGGPGWLWRLDLFCRRFVVLFSGNSGERWLKWARNSRDARMADIMFERSARCGNRDGLYEWARICKNEMRGDSAIAALARAAQLGHLEAAWEMGEAARWGYHMAKDRAASRRYYELAARQGHIPSIRTLAYALEIGDGLDPDPEAALRWQNRLQALLEKINLENTDGIGSDADLPAQGGERARANSFLEALRFLKELSGALTSRVSAGLAKPSGAVFFWGVMSALALYLVYILLSGTYGALFFALFLMMAIIIIFLSIWSYFRSYRPDPALINLEKQAGAGQPMAMYQLGMLYRHGSPCLPQDLTTARQWFLRAAEAGHTEAMLNLGQLMAWGQGGPPDTAQARHWLLSAKRSGIAEADVYLQRMAGME